MTVDPRCVGHFACSCSEQDPPPIHNRAGLPAIRRRVGTYSSFRTQILGGVADVVSAVATEASEEARPAGWSPVESPLERWTARTSDDIGVAIIEAASITLDVLTFYQERIANEAYLRTARDGESIEAMVTLLGYELSPGVTAATHLVFDIDPERRVTVPAWTQVQSVPTDDEMPETFETTTPLAAFGALSRMRPVPSQRTLRGPTSTLRFAVTPGITTGDLVLVGRETSAVQRRVTSLDEGDSGTLVHLSGPVEQDDGTRLWAVRETARGYGADLPTSAVHTYLDQNDSWTTRTVHRPSASSGAAIYLDRSLDPSDTTEGVATVTSDGTWVVHPIGEVTVTQRGKGPVERTVTRVTRRVEIGGSRFFGGGRVGGISLESPHLPLGVSSLSDAPIVGAGDPVYLVGSAAWPEQQAPADTFPAGTTRMTFTDRELVGLEPGRNVIVEDGAHVHLATIVEVSPGSRMFEFQPALPVAFDAASTVVHGNVVEGRHGERHTLEPLGDGDPTSATQEFKLRRGPLAWRLDGSSPQGASPDIEVRVNDLTWSWVSRRAIEPSDEPRFAIATKGDDAYVQIGLAAGGASASRGKRNVVADYRVGGGAEGNVAAGSLATPLDRPSGLRGVFNPLPAHGGTDRELPEHARHSAPAALRATGRIVALPDFEYAALDFPGVAKAHATWTWGDSTQLLHLTVAGHGGAILAPESLGELHRFLDRQRDDRRPLQIDNYTAVPIRLRVEVAADERMLPDAVATEVVEAIRSILGFDHLDFGLAVEASAVTERLHQIDSVLGVRWLELSRATTNAPSSRRRRRAPGIRVRSSVSRPRQHDSMPRVPIRGAAAAGGYEVRPAELAVVDVTRRDISVKSVPRPESTT